MPNDPAVLTEGLCKVFRVPMREAGLAAATRSLVRRDHRDVVAVGFAATVPSESLTGRMTWERVVLSAVLIALATTRLIWRLGTEHDAGASA